MKTDDASSRPTSATTYTSAPTHSAPTPAESARRTEAAAKGTGSSSPSPESKPHTPPGEADYLSKQADDARQAISRVLSDLKRQVSTGISSGIDPKGWTREHPVAMLGAAVVAGFAAAAVTIPSKEEQALKRLAEFERLAGVRSSSAAPAAAVDGETKADPAKPAKPSLVMSLIHELVSLAKPAITSAIAANFSAKAATADQDQKDGTTPPPYDPSATAGGGGGSF